jgi:hypothetical protein
LKRNIGEIIPTYRSFTQLGPSMVKALFNYIENKTPLDAEIDIKRFEPKAKK